ncbi:hypothetical protein CYMTET_41770 [Cymbomonas tetramitiformis]|uniref:Uncharacterized protein n=1 Tax=Cymbomonas tetramitiformis TaxID=36881 RepID=A0AAE0F264_9CHLO|nr:hypothetical protein CYMTET_41770 [Cymbomonas tetramitiformis]
MELVHGYDYQSGSIKLNNVSPSYCEDSGCNYECAKEYAVTSDTNGYMQLVPSSNPSGCECYTGNAVMTSSSRAYGSFGGYITFAAYITSGTDDGITVLVNAECYGNYQVSSGIVLGQKPSSADDDDDVIAIAIGVSVSVLVLLMICFGIFLVQQRRQQNNQHTIPGEITIPNPGVYSL